MKDKNRLGFDIEPKPLDKLPEKDYRELIKPILKELDMKGKEVPQPKYNFSDYWNIILGLLRNKSLRALGLEKPQNHTLQLILISIVVIGLIVLAILTN